MTWRERPLPRRRMMTTALLIAALPLAACDLSVQSPATVEDEKLENEDIIQTGGAGLFQFLINGGRAELGTAAIGSAGPGGLFTAGALLTDELVYSGTEPGMIGLNRGATSEDWQVIDGLWAGASRARFVGESGADRMRRQIGAVDTTATSSQLLYLSIGETLAGFSNRIMGDHFCSAVINAGPEQDATEYYRRAEDYFSRAIETGTIGNVTSYKLAGYAGRAQVRMMTGDWAGALADAAEVPTNYYSRIFLNSRATSSTNFLAVLARTRYELTVWGTPFEDWGRNRSGDDPTSGDPRVQYDVLSATSVGADNETPLLAERKYINGSSDAPMARGTEMRLIEAEGALVLNQDIAGAVDRINEVRTYRKLDLVDPADITSLDEAWQLLMRERGVELWLEGRRLPDLRRWSQVPGNVSFEVVGANGQVRNAAEADLCLPFSAYERFSNPNL